MNIKSRSQKQGAPGSIRNCRERTADCKEASLEYWGRFLTSFG